MTFVATWMDLEIVILCEVSQSKRDILMWILKRNGKMNLFTT